jgi:hypothetical protein
MRVLFVPHHTATIPHGIPLLALNQKRLDPSVETTFLLPRPFHTIRRAMGVNVLDIDHQGLRTEMQAYGTYKPDVVVDDCSLSTGYAAALSGIPRVTILRTGTFPNYVPRNSRHRHSMEFDLQVRLPDVTFMGLAQPKRLEDLFDAALGVIPGVRSIEALPDSIREDPRYVFSGPLLVEDHHIEQMERALYPPGHDFMSRAAIESFLNKNRGRRIIYVTFGNVAVPKPETRECIRRILKSGVAVLSNAKVESMSAAQTELFYHSAYFPMHFVCSTVDLVIHQCGSGTYHYPLIHEKPAITVGSRCFDRDDVALRLQELGVSEHIADPKDEPAFVEKFIKLVEAELNRSGQDLVQRRNRIADLRAEIENAREAFRFEEILRRAIEAPRKSKSC